MNSNAILYHEKYNTTQNNSLKSVKAFKIKRYNKYKELRDNIYQIKNNKIIGENIFIKFLEFIIINDEKRKIYKIYLIYTKNSVK